MCKYEQVKESKRLVKCFLNYLRHDKAEVNVLFEMLSIFLVRTRIDYTFLKEFYMVEVNSFALCDVGVILRIQITFQYHATETKRSRFCAELKFELFRKGYMMVYF